jgi:hypothetical protein
VVSAVAWLLNHAFAWLSEIFVGSTVGSCIRLFSFGIFYGTITPLIFLWLASTWQSANKFSSGLGLVLQIAVKALVILLGSAEVYVLAASGLPAVLDSYSELRDDPEWGPRSVDVLAGGSEIAISGYLCVCRRGARVF